MPRQGGDRRGNNRQRARRKQWMLDTFGDGRTCPCTHCGARLDYPTIESDRIDPDGPYRRENVQPSCRFCNASRSNNPEWISPLLTGVT